jgi:protease-4
MHRRPSRPAALRALIAVAALPLGCITINLPGGPPPPLVETVVHGESGDKILMLSLDGVLSGMPDTDLFGGGESPVARAREELEKAREDDAIRALLVRIDSPGGSVSASDNLYQEILRFKRERNVPVVAQLMGVAASGGYYVSMAADRVLAQPTTVTGSIGVIFGGVNLAGLMEKIGVENQTLVSGPYKDAGSMLRPMSDAERGQLQSVLDDMFERFVDVVVQGRPRLAPERVRALADGRIYSASQALEQGLVDGIGSIEDAVAAARREAGLSEARVVSYHRPREYRSNLYSATLPSRRFDLQLSAALPKLPQASFLYLWPSGFPRDR